MPELIVKWLLLKSNLIKKKVISELQEKLLKTIKSRE